MIIERKDVLSMIEHWLSTPPNAYFGLDYGADLNGFLLVAMSEHDANQFIAKLKRDIPLLADVDINLFAEEIAVDKKRMYLQVGEVMIDLAQFNQGLSNAK